MPRIENWQRLQSKENSSKEYVWKHRGTQKRLVVKNRATGNGIVHDVRIGKDTLTSPKRSKTAAYNFAIKWMKSGRYKPKVSNWRYLGTDSNGNVKWVNDKNNTLVRTQKHFGSGDTKYSVMIWNDSRSISRTVTNKFNSKDKAEKAARNWISTHPEPDFIKLQDNPKSY